MAAPVSAWNCKWWIEEPALDRAAIETIKLMIVDDHAMFREGLVRSIEKEADLQVVGQFASSAEALAALHNTVPQIVLLDIDLGAERAQDFIARRQAAGFKSQDSGGYGRSERPGGDSVDPGGGRGNPAQAPFHRLVVQYHPTGG